MNVTERADEALRWLRFAAEDLHEAEQWVGRSESVPRHICWFAQQAVEKALKAALILEDMEVPFWHNRDALRNLLPSGWSVKQEYPDLAELTVWAVEARYPGDWGGRSSRGGPGKGGLRLHCQGLRATRGETRRTHPERVGGRHPRRSDGPTIRSICPTAPQSARR
jgi:HEPN domain-containing protein